MFEFRRQIKQYVAGAGNKIPIMVTMEQILGEPIEELVKYWAFIMNKPCSFDISRLKNNSILQIMQLITINAIQNFAAQK
tara:strand:- start:204 stop:443 length:240 start_codon:yes stop_codon:yes gene_type:complete